jgi:prepilin-type N-terminal cleavage/methylation domain-containing protein
MKRAFSLVEMMVVVAVIGVSGSLAMFAMSDQITEARARSDQLGMMMRIKAERDKARERLTGVIIDRDAGGSVVVFKKAHRVSGACVSDGVTSRASFGSARIHVPSGGLCLDDRGLPVNPFATLQLTTDGLPELDTEITISAAGVFESSLDNKLGADTSGATGEKTGAPPPPPPQ